MMASSNGLLSANAYASGEKTVTSADKTAAVKLVSNIHKDLREIDTLIRNHKYFSNLQKKLVPAKAVRVFAGHQYHTATSDLRSIAFLVQRFGDHPVAASFFNGVLQGEFAAVKNLLVLAQKLGMTEDDLIKYEVSPEGFTYASYMAWQSVYASAAEIVCGLLVNFPAWGHNCGQMSKALRDNYGFSEKDTVFLDSFANMPSFEDVATVIIQDGLDNGVLPEKIHRSARLFQGYEKMFWDAMACA